MRRFRAPAVAAIAAVAAIPATALPAPAPRASLPTTPTAPSPTTTALTLLWPVRGDRDRDARVAVDQRVAGTARWSRAMSLRRTPAGALEGFSWPERHAGSIMGLRPGTRYEVRLRLRDPDGGSRTRVLRARTRPVPAPAGGPATRTVTPATLASALDAARPGDIIELGAGRYPGFTVDVSGAPGRPIVIRGTDGAVIDGEVGIFERRWVHLDRLTVNGRVRFNGTHDFAITRSTVTATRDLEGHGIITYLPARNAYIADNTVTGVTPWTDAAMGAEGANLGEGILVTGPGHVITHNRVRGFRDGISLMEDAEARSQFSIDITFNEVSQAGDDGVEADFCAHDCRITHNRLTDVFVALSSQPGLGGPTYFVRNSAFNVTHVVFKPYRGSTGDVLLNNTAVKTGDAFGVYSGRPVTRLVSRNNLFIGGPGGTFGGYQNGTGRPLDARTLVRPDMDFDAFGTSQAFAGVFGTTRYTGLAELRARTTERHAVAVDMSAFASAAAFPSVPLDRHPAQDLRPAAGAAVVDAGTVLPGVTDGFAGARPDIGAYEAGTPLPDYGPRG
ncbi:MAG: right-handed parallel beta-helix repeat-containing protein [Thermoleophilia bacterium]|nr:right-handed parallel beta-helix repeat-containing protein [Thermoleophilia bacterium]